ncbi:polysaccharide deacetylase family protein [Planctomycetes bacterium K23_9]|uniref:Polysaccharide deacetylase n=1 Tax=Stieleria marina TaxID=1930275 RepID=A0A517NYU1_9BACT|nr:hypothetical protein K239x_42820 [Planctomycetes bacterium K23_9]
MAESQPVNHGAFVISLDFELHWGLRDVLEWDSPEAQKLNSVWAIVPRLLQLFDRFEIAATWAVVGMLFAEGRQELEESFPSVQPQYKEPELSPYGQRVGDSHVDDPLHYGLPLIRQIQNFASQEIASHTYSHYLCLEPGQSGEAFQADLEAGGRLAESKGVLMSSIVFPRNQHNSGYDDLLVANGITNFRGNPNTWLFRNMASDHKQLVKRLFRLLDAYCFFGNSYATKWSEIGTDSGLFNVPGSIFLRPYTESRKQVHRLHVQRIKRAMTYAAKKKRVFHLWWHPHNFSDCTEQNFKVLAEILEHFRMLNRKFGMRSQNMQQVAAAAKDK